jgi:acyl-[acyl carrier protein]--UDP-N-acetylglucosamine O-acyltransferase
MNHINSYYPKTSSIFDVKDKSFTFARNDKYLELLLNTEKEVFVLLPSTISEKLACRLPNNVRYSILDPEDNVEYVWTYIHNKINEDVEPQIYIGEDCRIHETAIIGLYGNTYAKAPDGSRIHLKEIGGVYIGDRVDVEAYSIVHRSCFGDTIVEDDVKVCVMCNIGHNTKTGKRTYIAPGVKLGGGTQIGEDCFIWQGVITHSKVKICDKVMVGNNSYVHRDITESGIYAGSPAKFIKPFDERVLKGEIQW